MKGDFTRSTFRPQRHFRNVLIQQGRVQTDADLNEQADLTAHRAEVGSADVIGACGAPLENAGFGLLSGATPRLTAGHFYVDGILCENDAEITLDRQPDLPGFTIPTTDDFYLAYLDAFEEHVTALEDPLLREEALGGPDTATRQRTTWQVKLMGPFPEFHCSTLPDEWNTLLTRPLGGLRARTNPGSVSNDPCIISPGGGFRRLENQLYRVEIHTAGNRGTARFKWSRDNGSIVTSWKNQQGSDLEVGSVGRDQVLGFAPGQTIELIDRARELRGEAGILVRLSGAEGQMLTMDSTDPAAATVDKAAFPDLNSLGGLNAPKARRWDSDGTLATSADWVALEDGVEVSFEPGNYRVGDYWLVPARTATDDVEWPREADGDPIAQPPHGVHHHYCKLAVLRRQAGSFTVMEDCRPLFPALTSLLQFSYLGGDGQESLPGAPLAEPLRVGVTLGGLPVGAGPLAGYHYQVQFTASDGGLIPAQPMPVVNGIAECTWQLAVGDGRRPTLAALRSQTVTARLLDSAGTDLGLPSIVFNASLSLSSRVEFHPKEECMSLAGVETVEDAIDRLCVVQKVNGHCCITVGEGGDYVSLDQAILDLVKNKEQHIYICLLPGVHDCPRLDLTSSKTALGHLRINGGANSELRLKESWDLVRFASVTFENLIIRVGRIGNSLPFLHLADCGQVTIRNCQISAQADAGVLLGIEAYTHVLLDNNQIDVARISEAPKQVFTDTVLKELFLEGSLVSAGFLSSTYVESTFKKMTAKERRIVSANISGFVDKNVAALNPEIIKSLTDTAAILNSRNLDVAKVNEKVLEIFDTSRMPGRAIYINAPRAQVTLRSNQIYGEVSFYGPSPRQSLKDEDILKILSGIFTGLGSTEKIRLVTAGGTLQLQGNQFTTLSCGELLIGQMRKVVDKGSGSIGNLASSMSVSDNSFTQNSNILAALHIDMHHNQLAGGGNLFHAACIGISGVYVGNCGRTRNGQIVTTHSGAARENAANLGISIKP